MTIVYVIFIILTAYFSYRYDGMEEDPHKSHRYWLMCLFLICLSGFSYGLGGDKFVYMRDFESMPTDMSYSEFARFSILFKANMPGWSILTLWIKRTFNSFYVLQFVQSTFVNIVFCHIAKKYTRHCFLFLLTFFLTETFFQFNTEVMREGISIAIALIAIEQYFSGNKILFLLVISIGLLFHISILIMLAFPLISFTISKRNIIILCILSFVVWFLSDVVFAKIVTALLGGQGELVKKAVIYSAMASTFFGYARNAITYLFLPSVMCYCYMQASKANDPENLYRNKQRMVSFLLTLAFIGCSLQGFSRFQNYTRIFYLIIFTEFMYNMFATPKHLIPRLGTAICIWGLTILSFFSYYPHTNFYFFQFFVPYTSILNENRDVFIRETAQMEATTPDDFDKGQRDIK